MHVLNWEIVKTADYQKLLSESQEQKRRIVELEAALGITPDNMPKTLKEKIVRYLDEFKTAETKDLTKAMNRSPQQINNVVRGLVKQGVIARTPVGKGYIYSIAVLLKKKKEATRARK